MLPTLSQVCSLDSPFEKDIQDYAAGQCQYVELWMTKLEQYLAQHTADEFRQLCETHQVQTPVASFQGGLLTTQGESRKAAWELFEQRLRVAQDLQIKTLVVACDITGTVTRQVLERTQASLKQAAEMGEQHQVRLALEFNAKSSFGNNAQTATALVEEVGSGWLGICLDLFHFYTGPSKLPDLGLLTTDNLFHVQLCDLADVPRELASDSDRIMPGEGDLPTDPVIEHLRSIKYSECVSIEIMNPMIWQVPAMQFGEIGMTSLRKLLGQAEH